VLCIELPRDFILLYFSYARSSAPAECVEDVDTEESRDYIHDNTVV